MKKTKLIDGYPFVSYTKETYSADEMIKRAMNFMSGWIKEEPSGIFRINRFRKK